MKISQHTRKDGSAVYRSSVYLGNDQVTGKQVTTKVTGRTKKEVKQKAHCCRFSIRYFLKLNHFVVKCFIISV